MQEIYNTLFCLFLVIPEVNTNILYIINIIRIKRNFKSVAGRAAAIKITIIIRITAAVTAAAAVIRPALFIIKKPIIRYQAQLPQNPK